MVISFDSWNSFHKSVFGAAKSGIDIFFRIILSRNERTAAARLVFENDNGGCEKIGMFWAGMQGDDFEIWDVTYQTKMPGLYFYYFEIDTESGTKYINKISSHKGEISDSVSAKWQQTVYQKELKTPDWLKGGIIYQIFPDRFAKSGETPKELPSGRILRDDWGKMPEYSPDTEGFILNNDYFGGNLCGITQKLPYLSKLSVTCIYLNPIFEAHSNHRYDTADYEKIDPLLGTETDYVNLCKEAEKYGIKIILDGVFSHTGADSRYFNKYKRYGDGGAYNTKESPYYSWYKFKNWPNDYLCWWDILILPELIEETSEYIDYISGKGGILEHWQNLGGSGYRLDVADELPDVFLDALRQSVKKTDENAVIIGEVWEDASNKTSYGHRRRYLLGDQLDSVMNYPFYNAIVDFLKGGNAKMLNDTVMCVLENYPKESVDLLMNHIGTHDTERVLTLLGGESTNGRDRHWQSLKKMNEGEMYQAKRRLKLASAIQFFLPGVPSVYYGDEAGMEGYRDPFNRYCYPWGKEDNELIDWYQKLGRIRQQNKCMEKGIYQSIYAYDGIYIFERQDENGSVVVAVNASENDFNCRLENELSEYGTYKIEIGTEIRENVITLSSMSVAILTNKK